MNRIASMTFLVLGALTLPLSASAAAPANPGKVKEALQLLAYIQADMASKLPNKAYDRLPHENDEYQEAAPALVDALAKDPPALRDKVASLLKRSQAAAQAVADVSKSHDESKITAAVAAVDTSLRAVEAAFPAELRPIHGKLGRGPGGKGNASMSDSGPPADLR